MRTLARRLAELIGTGFYSGYFPIAPGTVGSAVGVGIYAALITSGLLSAGGLPGWLLAVGIVFGVGLLSAWYLEKHFGSDNRRIVIDEIWGMLVSLALLPPNLALVIGGFLLFRFFDIVKPFPARRAERIGRGVGVMLDDGIAGVYANLVLHLARLVLG